jgi:hypothetical protein
MSFSFEDRTEVRGEDGISYSNVANQRDRQIKL